MFTVPKSFNSAEAFMLFRYVRLNARNLPVLKPNNEGPVQALRELKHSAGEAVEKSCARLVTSINKAAARTGTPPTAVRAFLTTDATGACFLRLNVKDSGSPCILDMGKYTNPTRKRKQTRNREEHEAAFCELVSATLDTLQRIGLVPLRIFCRKPPQGLTCKIAVGQRGASLPAPAGAEPVEDTSSPACRSWIEQVKNRVEESLGAEAFSKLEADPLTVTTVNASQGAAANAGAAWPVQMEVCDHSPPWASPFRVVSLGACWHDLWQSAASLGVAVPYEQRTVLCDYWLARGLEEALRQWPEAASARCAYLAATADFAKVQFCFVPCSHGAGAAAQGAENVVGWYRCA